MKAQDFALLRAAELCQTAGFTHFRTGDNVQTSSAGPGVIIPIGTTSIYTQATYPESTITIECTNIAEHAYAAAFITKTMREKYRL